MQLQAQGELQRTDQPLDLALDGDGLLLVRDKSGTLGGVRTGAFHITKEGRIQDPKGLTLQGYPLMPEDGAASATVQSLSPPSVTFIGPLGGLEDIQLIKPDPAPPLEAPVLSNPYGTGWSTRKEADGLYSFHGSALYWDWSGEYTSSQRSFVDSLGQERTAIGWTYLYSSEWSFILKFADLGPPPSCEVFYHYDSNGGFAQTSNCTFDETSKQIVVTFPDTGATLTFDLSDMKVTGGDLTSVAPEGTLLWAMPPTIFEEGISQIEQEFVFEMNGADGYVSNLVIERKEDGSFIGHLLRVAYGFEVEIYFNEEGRVSGYQFTKNGNSTDDPSVGVEQTGSVVKGVHYFVGNTGIDCGIIDIDLSVFRVIDKTKPPKEEVIPEEVKEGFAPLSPSSLSIDENGVLKRLKDDGDWEPIYLLACGQFAAMNAAEERNGVYYATPASGAIKVGVAGKDGMGTITSGTLERSTTDLAHELSDMIRAQHAYAANTKVLSTIGDMLTELERL
ncbi:MAG: hypothetical protein LBJ70_02600 [Holosporales bacterium]|jgi:flagellar hook protein FlgE|nr:hypothetical protein [Holosporales bacterium]